MQQILGGRFSRPARQAITDLYDEKRGAFLVQYPIWLVLLLGLAGVAAFAITGFLGYGEPGTLEYRLFADPYLLVGWFYLLLLILEYSIFRHPSLASRRVVILTVFVICMGIVAWAYFNIKINTLVDAVIHFRFNGGLLRRFFSNPIALTVMNLVILGIFWLDTARRWVRRAQGLSPNPRVNLGSYDEGKEAPELAPMTDVVSGDLIAGGVLSLILALFFREDVIRFITQPNPVNSCTVALFGSCSATSLTTLNYVFALIALVFGLVVLAMTAVLSGLGAVGGVNAAQLDRPHVAARASAGAALDVAPSGAESVERSDTSGRTAMSEEVSLTILSTLRNVLDRRLRLILFALLLSLRNILWPLLALISTFSIAIACAFIEAYLHSGKTINDAYSFMLPSLIFGVVAALAAIFSPALFVFRWRVASNSLRFLGLIGFVVLLTLWIFSLALAGLNLLLLPDLLNVTDRSPFYPPSWSTLISFGALLVFGSIALIRYTQARRNAPPAPQATTVDVPADAPASER
jgi:hypothetical protein